MVELAEWLLGRFTEGGILDLLLLASRRRGWSPYLNALGLQILKPASAIGEEAGSCLP
jgi:hypothetical protein